MMEMERSSVYIRNVVPFSKELVVTGKKEQRVTGKKEQRNVTKRDDRAERPIRADARRNLNTLLKAAMAVFTKSGVDAPMREIAEKAGVGVGTIYRHFPERAGLIAAVFRNEIDACANAAPELAAQYAPDEALRRWVERYVGFIGAKRGLAAALHSGDPAYDVLPAYFEKRLRPALQGLLETAASAGSIRAGVDPYDLLAAIARLCASTREGDDPARAQRMIGLLLDGLCYGVERG
jgi:AcrR family transcriptional regulator